MSVHLNRHKRISASSCLSICPSVRMYYSTSRWTDSPEFDVCRTVHHCDNWRIITNQMPLIILLYFLSAQHVSGTTMHHHQELATIMLITTLVVSFLVCCMLEAGISLQPGHYSRLTALNLQPTANQERNDQRGNQHHSRELLMMGTVVPETCWAYKKYNKIKSGI